MTTSIRASIRRPEGCHTETFQKLSLTALAVLFGVASNLVPISGSSQDLPPARVVAPGSCYDNNSDPNLAAARNKLAQPLPANIPASTKSDLSAQQAQLTASFTDLMGQLSAEYTDCLALYNRDVGHQGRCPNNTSSTDAQYVNSCNNEAALLDQQYGALQGRLQATKTALLETWLPAFGKYMNGLRTAAVPANNTMLNASGLRDVMNDAAAGVACMPTNMSCSTFFHDIGSELAKRGLPANGTIWTNRQLDANAIANALAVANQSQWRRVSASQVQGLADRGILVVAVQEHAGHGHVAVAAPTSDGVPDNGSGPYLRDGDSHHDPTCNCTWNTRTEAHHQSKAFSSLPTWYEWVPSAGPAQ